MAQHKGDYVTFRYGAPAAVVDPILSFLYDLRRMETTLLSALAHMGVDCHSLPPPFGEDAKPCTTPPARGDTVMTTPKTTAATAATNTNSGVAQVERLNEKKVELLSKRDSALDAYVRTALPDGADPSPAEVYAAVQRVLAWLDSLAAPVSAPPARSVTPPPSASDSSAMSRSLIAAFVTAGDAHDACIKDCATNTTVHVRRAEKRHKAEAPIEDSVREDGEAATAEGVKDVPLDNSARSNSSNTLETNEGEGCLFSLSSAELHTTLAMSRRYEKLLRGGTKHLASTLRAVTTADLAASYSCHAKWVEVAREDAKTVCVLPSSKTLQRNYEQLIRLNDAFATCQAAVHNAYVELEEHVDVLLEEAPVIARAERSFQRDVAQACVECEGLQALRQRLKRTRAALEKAASLEVCET